LNQQVPKSNLFTKNLNQNPKKLMLNDVLDKSLLSNQKSKGDYKLDFSKLQTEY